MATDLFLYMGMLGGGKTMKIREDIAAGTYDGYHDVLLIQNEDGMEAISDEFLTAHNINRVFIMDPQEYRRATLDELNAKYSPDVVLIEVHGIWPVKVIARELPREWWFRSAYYCADALEFQQQFDNMDRMIAEKIKSCREIYIHSAQVNTEEKLQTVFRLFPNKKVFYRA